MICRTGDDGFDKPHEECGVFGIYDPSVNVTPEVYYGLFALQHRGQESAGMTLVDGDGMKSYRAMGLVTEVFRTLRTARGHILESVTSDTVPPVLLFPAIFSLCRQIVQKVLLRWRITAIWSIWAGSGLHCWRRALIFRQLWIRRSSLS